MGVSTSNTVLEDGGIPSADFLDAKDAENNKVTPPFKASSTPPTFNYRDDFAKYIGTGKAVEVGTRNGDFAKKNLSIFGGQYYMVDIVVSDTLQRRLNRWASQPQVHFLKIELWKAAPEFNDKSLDWVYIDNRHG